MEIFQTILLLLIAAGVGYIAFRLFRGDLEIVSGAESGEAGPEAPAVSAGATDQYDRRLQVYREVVRVLTKITQDGDISREELLEFRSRTNEAGFLFDKGTAGYIEEIYQRGSKLAGTNQALKDTKLSIGEERDAITVENSRQLIWLADQLSQLNKRFARYFEGPDRTRPSGA
jgi:hypothetical protein